MRIGSQRDTNIQLMQRSPSPSLPLQVQFTDIIVLNDALGETFYFSANLIDSFEVYFVCITMIKRLANTDIQV